MLGLVGSRTIDCALPPSGAAPSPQTATAPQTRTAENPIVLLMYCPRAADTQSKRHSSSPKITDFVGSARHILGGADLTRHMGSHPYRIGAKCGATVGVCRCDRKDTELLTDADGGTVHAAHASVTISTFSTPLTARL